MTKRISRITDAALIRIEAQLAHLDARYGKFEDHDDPAVSGEINDIFDQMSALEKRAIERPPATLHGLAVQARIVGRIPTDPGGAKRLIANIQAFADEPPPKPGIRLRHGKRYRNRQGEITAPMDQIDSRGLFFGDNCTGNMYEVDGRCIGWGHNEDLVEEVMPPRRQSAQLAPIESEGPDKRGRRPKNTFSTCENIPSPVHAPDAREERVAA